MTSRWVWSAALVAACGSSQTPPATGGGGTDTEPAPAIDAGPTAAEREAEQVAAIEFAVNQGAPAVHACYKRATSETLKVDGRVVLDIAFDASGYPEVKVAEDQTESKRLRECLAFVYKQFPWPAVFAAGDQIQLPLSFVAADAQYTVQRADVTRRQVAPGLAATVVLDTDSTGNGAAAVTVLEIAKDFVVPLHTHTSAEVLYVLSGGGKVMGVKGDKDAQIVTAGGAIYLPAGVPHAFTASADSEIVQLYAPGGPEQRFEGRKAEGTTPMDAATARKLARKRNAPRPLVLNADAATTYPIGPLASVQIVFDADSAGDKAAYVGKLTVKPGMKVPEHIHAAETELLYVVQGAGVMTVAGEAYDVAAGMGVQVPPGVKHSFEVTSTEDVVVVQFYTPSGPEQRFKAPKK